MTREHALGNIVQFRAQKWILNSGIFHCGFGWFESDENRHDRRSGKCELCTEKLWKWIVSTYSDLGTENNRNKRFSLFSEGAFRDGWNILLILFRKTIETPVLRNVVKLFSGMETMIEMVEMQCRATTKWRPRKRKFISTTLAIHCRHMNACVPSVQFLCAANKNYIAKIDCRQRTLAHELLCWDAFMIFYWVFPVVMAIQLT